MGTVVSDALEHNKIISADNWKFNTASAAIPIIFLGNILITCINTQQVKMWYNVIKRQILYQKLKVFMDERVISFNISALILWYGNNDVLIL